jgi:hypothetical protein
MPFASDRDAVRASLNALLDTLPGPVTVIVITPAGLCQPFQLPQTISPPINLTPCSKDILYVLGEAGHRMTTPEILSALDTSELIHGETTVKLALAKMVKDGVLDNRPDANPRGYGICQ